MIVKKTRRDFSLFTITLRRNHRVFWIIFSDRNYLRVYVNNKMFVFIKMNYSCNDTFRDRKIDNIGYMLKYGISENNVLEQCVI
jgi:hypothetical protein